MKDFIVTFPDVVIGRQLNYAKTGQSADIFFKISDIPNVTKHVGFGLLCGYTYNAFDVNSYMQYALFYQGATKNVPSSGYQTSRFLPGLIFSYGKKLAFNFRIMGGVLLLKTPVMDYQTQTPTYYHVSYQSESQSGNDLVYDFGIGLKYSLSPKISMLLNADYFRSTPEIGNTGIDYFFKISEISATLGIGYTF